MNKADVEKRFKTLAKTIEDKKYKLETLINEQQETEQKLYDAKKEYERLFDLTGQYQEKIHHLKLQIDIANCEIEKAHILQKELISENEHLREKRVKELKLILAKKQRNNNELTRR